MVRCSSYRIFVIGSAIIRLFEVSPDSRVQVATMVGLIVVTLARAIPMPGAWVLSDVPAESRLDFDRAIELAKKANVGTTADPEYLQLKLMCTGSKEIEALLVIAQFGGELPLASSRRSCWTCHRQWSEERTGNP